MSKKLLTWRSPEYRRAEFFCLAVGASSARAEHVARNCSYSAGLLFNPSAWWLGLHYSPFNRRACINIIPCLTIWVRLPRGTEP